MKQKLWIYRVHASAIGTLVALLLHSCAGDEGGGPAAKCGNGALDPGEACDGEEFGGATCASEGLGSGELSCSGDCRLDTSGCAGEACDPTCDESLCEECVDGECAVRCAQGEECAAGQCMAREKCDNGAVDEGEECDGENLSGTKCEDLGHAGGTLVCTAECAFDETGCHDCGNAAVDEGEECDGENLNDTLCEDLGYSRGDLRCTAECAFDETGCVTGGFCGDGAKDAGEDCDGALPDGMTCVDLGYESGELACIAGCSFDETACSGCATDDGFEENDAIGQAAPIQAGIYDGLWLCNAGAGEEDWFSIGVEAGHGVAVAIRFLHSHLDLDMEMQDSAGNELDASSSSDDVETVSYAPEANETVYVRVYPYRDGSARYSMRVAVDPQCAEDYDCAEGEVCENFECVPGCRDDWTCDTGMICLDAQCVPGCREEWDCPDEQVCARNECVVPECLDHAECPDGEICEDYDCVVYLCGDDAPCPDYLYCTAAADGKCVECLTAADCPNETDFTCEENRCLIDCEDAAPGDSPGDPVSIQQLPFEPDQVFTLCGEDDENWYEVELKGGFFYTFDVAFSQADGDIQVYLYKEDDLDTSVASGTGFEDGESFAYGVPVSSGGKYYIEVALDDWNVYVQTYSIRVAEGGQIECFGHTDCNFSFGEVCADFRCVALDCETETCPEGLLCDGATGHCVECLEAADCPDEEDFKCDGERCILLCNEDEYEPNSDPADAKDVGSFPFEPEAALTLCGEADDDWFKLTLEESRVYVFEIAFDSEEGDIDLYLYPEDDLENSAAQSTGSADTERITHIVPAGRGGIYLLKVHLYRGYVQAYSINAYDLGVAECAVAPDCGEGKRCVDFTCVEPPAGDTCAAPIAVEGGFPFEHGVEDIRLFENDVEFESMEASCTGFTNGGSDVIYRVTVAAGQTIEVEVTSTYDASVYITSDCVAVNPDCLAGADESVDELETTSYESADGGTYFVIVDYYSSAGGPSEGSFNVTIDAR